MTIGSDGVARIAGTRVTLDSLVAAFHEGLGAEEIAQQYPSLALADIYSVIGYYLRHQSTLDAYLQERQVQGERTRAANEARFAPRGLRAKLLARRPESRA